MLFSLGPRADVRVAYLAHAAFPSMGRSRPKSGAAPSMATLVAARARYLLSSDGVDWLYMGTLGLLSIEHRILNIEHYVC
mgnify:CR=1 FL=1